MAEVTPGEPRYKAFLSYSHKDADAAGKLHRRLETYRLPKRLVGRVTPRGPVPQRLWPIFRDRDELPAATDLSETVREALAQSGALIVLCSPHSAASLWVAEEIETFRRLHPGRPVLAAVLEGDPPDCFPPVLRAFGQDGTWHEPLATDLRPQGDGPQLGLLKLIAGVTGIGLDDLVQRDAQRKIRRVTGVTAVALVAMLMMAALTLVALDARREAERQRAEAEGLIEFMLTDLREKLRGVGRLDALIAVNERALRYYGTQTRSSFKFDSLLRQARILHAMGEDEVSLAREAAAQAAFAEAHRATSALLARHPRDPRATFAHSQSEYWIGFLGYRRRDFAAARSAWQRYRDLAEQLVAREPRNPEWIREAGYAQGNLCTLLVTAPGDKRAALDPCRRALSHMETVRQIGGTTPEVLEDLVNRHAWLADAWRAHGRIDRSLFHKARQEGLARSLLQSDPENADYRDVWGRTQLTYGELLAAAGQRFEAQSHVDDAIAVFSELRARDPRNTSWSDMRRRAETVRQRLREVGPD